MSKTKRLVRTIECMEMARVNIDVDPVYKELYQEYSKIIIDDDDISPEDLREIFDTSSVAMAI